ncbi:amidase [Streptomyces sp. NPDC050610]|uniref:amidase n=1 Tax=Streptomyces sp. NPDC050610 TaxID=3157097 RepID=UPI003415B8DB
MGQLHDLTALEQGDAIRAGNLSPVELTEHYLERIERLDSTVGAFITVTHEIARKQAAEAERTASEARREGRELPPLHGVPVPVKDVSFVAGVRCTMGSAALVDHVPTVDDHVVTKLRAAGTVLLGKTNTSEFALPPYAENRVAPPARTPWGLDRSAGGSSGGAATTVASGLAPVAHGTDSGGSIRIPSSACGLFGLKPSRGRVGEGPALHDVSGMTAAGPLARTVADAAALLDVLAAPVPGGPFTAPALPPGETFAQQALRRPKTLRVACMPEPSVPGVSLHPDCREAVDEAADLLRELGHTVDELPPPVLSGGAAAALRQIWEVMAATSPVPPGSEELLTPLTRELRKGAAKVSGVEYAQGLQEFRKLGRLIADTIQPADTGYDVILTPTLAQPPVPVGSLHDDANPAGDFELMSAFTPYTMLYNATGQPAASVPLHWNVENLPIGVMLAARYGDEATLISLSAQLEEARPWAARVPALW